MVVALPLLKDANLVGALLPLVHPLVEVMLSIPMPEEVVMLKVTALNEALPRGTQYSIAIKNSSPGAGSGGVINVAFPDALAAKTLIVFTISAITIAHNKSRCLFFIGRIRLSLC